MREDCERFRVIASLRPDGELSGLELALHRAHATACGDCREFAAEVAGITSRIRATPPQGIQRRVVIAGRQTRKRGARLAAAFGIGLVISAGLGASQQRAVVPPEASTAGGVPGLLKAI